jgi:hypothetical protein
MGRKKQKTNTRAVEQLSQRIEHWRKTRLRRGRMPEELWEAAVEIAREHGVHATAASLRISYDALKRRVGVEAKGKRRVSRTAPAFVELSPGLPISMGGPVVELVVPSGGKLTIRL